MTKKFIITLLIFPIILVSCSQPAQIEEPSPEPTAVPATDIPTAEPEPTPTEERIESGFFSYIDNTWKPIFEDEMTGPVFLPEDMMGGDMEAMQLIQYSYFASYDENNNILSAYAKVFPGEIFRLVNFQLSENQNVICLPETVSDTSITNLTFLPNNGKVSFPPGPGNKSFADILTAVDTNTYMVLVLADAIDSEIANPVNQLAVVCPQQ